jgi:hypothetical protein
MYVTEYICFNEKRVAVRGVLMYMEKRDLSEKREGKILAIYTVHRMFPKRSHRKNIWKRIWSGGETRYLHVEITEYFIGKDQVRFVGTDIQVFDYQVRSLEKKCLGNDQIYGFNRFFYDRS